MLQRNLSWRVRKTILCYIFWTPWYDTFKRVKIQKNQLSLNSFCWMVMTQILLKESSKFKLHLKECLLIKRNRPELNRNIAIPYSFLNDCFHNLYFNIYVFTYIWVNYPWNFYEILSVIDSNLLLFENPSNERRKQKLILLKINMTLSKNYFLF